MFNIRIGLPEMDALWNHLRQKERNNILNKSEKELLKKWEKALRFLRNDPRHPRLNTHEINCLSNRYGMKVWQSYLENKKSGAARMYWVYGPNKEEITIIALEPHPEDKKKDAYKKIKLSQTGEVSDS